MDKLIIAMTAFLLSPALFAWNIGAKGHVTGPAIHNTYFLTTNNSLVKVHARAYVGNYINGICQYNALYDIGNEQLKTGDTIDIDAFALKSVIGSQFNCMTIYYDSRQLAMESFQLISDGINYIGTFPTTGAVTII